MNKITLLIPCYNEEGNLHKLYDALLPLIDNELTPDHYEWEVLTVNDGSRDRTLELMDEIHAKDSRFNYVDLSRNFGKEAAMLAGLDYATGDAVVILDADLQHPIDAIPLMIEQWRNGYDDVYGRKMARGRESWLRKKMTGIYYSLLRGSSKIDVIPNVGDFRLLDRQCVNALQNLRENQRYSKGLFSWIGFRKKEIPFECNDRYSGESHFSYRQLFSLAIDGITGFTTMPLRFASGVGIITALSALAYLVYVICKTVLYGDPVAGYPTLMCVILFLGGCQLIALGIIGEYIARIFSETKRRPPYVARMYNGDKISNRKES